MEAMPKIFVSSTVYDFADLRSALKYWLTEMGFEVFMSECPDFKKDSSGNSYDACLRAIEQCDYYLLLIGSRVGGYYSSDPQISITQQEYRTAYQQFEKGIIKRLFTFVREDIWTIKEDRKALHQYLKENYLMEKELSPDDVKRIESHDSTFVNDASFIFSFIDEVSKKTEMKAAVAGDKAFPLNNWINPFSSFEDIVNVLKAELRFHSDLSYKQWAELVAQDLAHNLAELTRKINAGTYHPLYLYAKNFRDKFPRQYGEAFESEYKDSLGAWLFTARSLPHIQNLRTELLKSAIQSCAFLAYDSGKADYQVSNIQKALSELVNIITNIQRLFDTPSASRVIENTSSIFQLKLKMKTRLNSADINLCTLVALYDSQYNIIELSRYLFAVLKCDYDETKYPKLLPTKIFDTDIDGDTFMDTEVSSEEMYRYMLGEE